MEHNILCYFPLLQDQWLTSTVWLCSSLEYFWLIHCDNTAINIAQATFSFFKPFPRKCFTPHNGPSNAVIVMSWTAAFLQDKLTHISLWNSSLPHNKQTHICSPTQRPRPAAVNSCLETLINISPLVVVLLSECHLPNNVPGNKF